MHRFLVQHRDIHHWDISPKNIYADPCWKYAPEDMLKKGPWPKFIKEILDYKKSVDQSSGNDLTLSTKSDMLTCAGTRAHLACWPTSIMRLI